MSDGPPPWQGQAQEPERTAEGLEIHHGRFGPYIRRPDGRCEPLPTPIKLRRPERRQEPADWSVWHR